MQPQARVIKTAHTGRGFRRAVAEGSQALELTDKAGVFSFEDYTLLDLSRID